MSIEVRQAHLEDIPQIHHLIHQLAQYERMEDAFFLTPHLLEQALFVDHSLRAKVALLEGEIRGVALYYVIFSTFKGQHVLKLEDLVVDEASRHQSLGKHLMKALAQEAAAKGYTALAWSCLTWNTPALMMYHQLGAKVVPDWLHFKLEGEALNQLLEQPISTTKKER